MDTVIAVHNNMNETTWRQVSVTYLGTKQYSEGSIFSILNAHIVSFLSGYIVGGLERHSQGGGQGAEAAPLHGPTG